MKKEKSSTIKYHDKMETSSTVEIDLSELDQPQEEIEKQLKKIYKNQVSNKLETWWLVIKD